MLSMFRVNALVLPSLVFCFALFGCCLLEAFCFMKGDKGTMDLEKREGRGVEQSKGGGENCRYIV